MRTAHRKATPDAPVPERQTGKRRRVVAQPAALVLIVDDSEDTRLVVGRYLELCDLRVEHAVDGEHALFKVMVCEPDAVVMDLEMPVLDGWEAIRQMKAHPRMRSIPVIALTGHVFEDSLERARGAGADAVLTKPCAPAVLHAVLSELLARALRHD